MEIAEAVADFESSGTGNPPPQSVLPPQTSAPVPSGSITGVDGTLGDSSEESSVSPSKKPRGGSAKKPGKKPPEDSGPEVVPAEPEVVPTVPSERDQALATILKQFVDRHPELGLHAFVADCDARWVAHTVDIRQGRLPTIADAMAIDDLISDLQHHVRNHSKRWELEMKRLGLPTVIGSHLDRPEWTNFLARIREIANRGK